MQVPMHTVRLTKRLEFRAAHRYNNAAWYEERHLAVLGSVRYQHGQDYLSVVTVSGDENNRVLDKCNNPNGHDHNYTLEVTLRGEIKPETGMVTDLERLDRTVEERVLKRFDHQHLNYEEAFADKVTTGENLVVLLWNLLEKAVPAGTLHKIGLVETRDNYFEYAGPGVGQAS